MGNESTAACIAVVESDVPGIAPPENFGSVTSTKLPTALTPGTSSPTLPTKQNSSPWG